jgi:hypothetical protein
MQCKQLSGWSAASWLVRDLRAREQRCANSSWSAARRTYPVARSQPSSLSTASSDASARRFPTVCDASAAIAATSNRHMAVPDRLARNEARGCTQGLIGSLKYAHSAIHRHALRCGLPSAPQGIKRVPTGDSPPPGAAATFTALVHPSLEIPAPSPSSCVAQNKRHIYIWKTCLSLFWKPTRGNR